MTRREAREQAFCILFEQTVRGEDVEEIIRAAAEARDLVPNSFTEELAYGAEEHQSQLDEMIGGAAKGWSLRRLSKVELAKTYGGQGDAPYINGVLATVVKNHCPGGDKP